MSVQIFKDYFKNKNISKEIIEFSSSSATVDLAAQAAGVEPARIAKTLSFYTKERDTAILIVTAGDTKIDNSKFKHFFSMKAKMLSPEDVETYTSVTTYLDVSLKRFSTVFPAAGSANSAVEVTCEELEKFAEAADWIDVCKTPSV